MTSRDVDIFGYSLGGSVSEMMNPNPPKRRLPQLTPAQSANFAGSFVPGAALAELLGEYPAAPSAEMTTAEMLAGPRAPSLAENISEGNLGTGIMQLLGAAGDAATVVPVLGPIIGGALKTPRALQKLARLEDAGIGSLPAQKVAFNENTLDMLEEILPRGAKVDEDGMVTLYHRTSPESASRILETGQMIGKEDRLFFGTKPDGQISGYGDSVVEVKIPADRLELDDIFDNEAHLTLKSNFKPQEINVVGTSGLDEGIMALPKRAPMNLDEQAELLGAVRFGAQIETPVMTADVFNAFGKEGVKKLERAFKSNQEDLITAEDLIQRSSSANPAFQQTIQGIANDVGGKKAPKFITTKKGEQFDVEVKSPSSIRKKVSRKGIKPSEFTDGVRTTIYVDNAEQADRAAAMIAKQYPALDDGWQRIPSTGYFDRKLNVIVKDPDGKPVIGEIQLKTPEMGEAAKVGHRWYDISRSLDDKFNEDIPVQKIRTYRAAMEEQKRLYGEAASKADPSIIDLVIDKFRLGGAVAALNRFYRM